MSGALECKHRERMQGTGCSSCWGCSTPGLTALSSSPNVCRLPAHPGAPSLTPLLLFKYFYLSIVFFLFSRSADALIQRDWLKSLIKDEVGLRLIHASSMFCMHTGDRAQNMFGPCLKFKSKSATCKIIS